MNEIFKLFGTVEVRTSQAQKDLDGITRKAEQAGKKMQGIGKSMQNVGSRMTKAITAPAVGAAAAVGGLVAAFGWGRLTGMDAAKAQLEGLGYQAQDVDRITQQVKASVQGTTMTMAEGTSVAAGALAAGIEEGEELEQYIRRVGNAAVGANRDIGDMAMIFNRVQGSGKLMTEELNMIEDGMPGFSQAMAKHFGVSLGTFREMVTAGEVSSKDFMVVMDDFAGDMAEANANSWAGLVSNAKAYIGILGENLLGGVFEQSKDAVRDFVEVMKSDDLREWAVATGEKLGNVFTSILEHIKNLITWFMGLSAPVKQAIAGIAGLLIAAGPLLLVFGKITAAVGTAINVFSKVSSGVGVLGKAFGFLTGPVGIAIGVIAALGAAFALAYNKSETFRNFINGIGSKLGGAWQKMVEFKDNVLSAFEAIFAIFSGDRAKGMHILRSLGITEENIVKIMLFVSRIRIKFEELKEGLSVILGNIKDFFVNVFKAMGDWWNANGETILGYVADGFTWMKETIGLAMDLIKAIWDRAWSIISGVIQAVWPVISGIISVALDVITGLFNFFAPIVTGVWNVLWTGIKTIIDVVWQAIKLVIGTAMDVIQGIIKVATALINGDWSKAWEAVRQTVSNVRDRVVKTITNMKDSVVNLIKTLVAMVVNFFQDLWKKVTTKVTDIKNNVVNTFTDMKKNVSNRVNELKNDTINRFKDIFNGVKKWMTNAKNSAIDLAKTMKDGVINRAKDILNYFTKLPGRLGNALTNGRNAFKAGFAKMLNAGISAVESGVNNIIKGINWVLNKLGADGLGTWNAPKVSVPKYAKGTSGHEGGPAIVGDGGQKELISYPDGSYAMSPDTDTLVSLPKGTQVLSGPKTKRLMTNLGIPKYKDGIGSKIKEKAGDFWQWVTEGASSLLDKGLNFMGVKKPGKDDGPGVFSSIAGGAFTKIKDAAVGFIQNQMDSLFSFGGVNFPGFTLTSRFGQRWGRMHEGLDYAAPMGTPIPSQTGGKVTQSRYHPTYGNFVEVASGGARYRYAHNSKNLVAVGDAVRAGQTLGLVGSTGRSTGPHVHFEVRVGGRAVDPLTFQGEGGGGFSAAGSGVQRWASVAAQALRMTGQYSSSNLNRLLMQMQSESGGNARAINNWDSNARRGTPSKGLMQVIDPTFNAYRMPGYNNIWNPLDNILASIRYSTSRYGSLTRAWRGVGYATGGLVGHGFYELGEEGYPEWIIPTDPKRRKDAIKLLGLAGKGLPGNKRPDDFKSPKSIVSSIPGGSSSSPDGQTSNVSGIEEKIDISNRLIEKLINLLSSETDINIDGATVGKVLFPHIDKNMTMQMNRNKTMKFKT